MRRVWRVAVLLLTVTVLGGCGSGGGGSSAAGASSSESGLVASVEHAQVHQAGKDEVASTVVKVGGRPGTHLTLEWGLVDAALGTESRAEQVLKRFVTTTKVVSATESVRVPLSEAASPVLVHFVIYAPNGSYLSSADTPSFGGQS